MKPCLVPGCPQPAYRAGPRCQLHERIWQAERNHRAGYRRTRAWQNLSKQHREENPVCVRCGATEDLTTDHVTPRVLDGGLQTLCRRCNATKGNRL